jgi:Rod binding domain-containing protein
MLPDTMADALVANGGIGLASDLVRSLRTQTP